jgi:hypothetical protein
VIKLPPRSAGSSAATIENVGRNIASCLKAGTVSGFGDYAEKLWRGMPS